MSPNPDPVPGLLLLIVGGVFYFIPYFMARINGHHNRTAIGLLNLFLGWTVLGWIASLIWANTKPPTRK